MAELNLDALCDLLDDEDEDQINDDQSGSEVQATSGASGATCDSDDGGDENDVTEMEEQLRLMQEQMRIMQEKLKQKKRKENSDPVVSSPPTPKAATTSKTVTTPKTPTTPTAGPSKTFLKEVDLFNNASGGSSKSNGKRETGPRSPVKTNPFESYDRPVRLAKLNPEANRFGPALPTKVTRVLSGEERLKLEQSLKEREQQRNFKMVSQDLDLSSDEDIAKRDDEDANPLGSRYSSYGQEINKIMAKKSVEMEKPKPAPLSQELGKKPVGFNSVQGSSLNLSQSSTNKLLPKGMLVEKHSRIRIANPEITQVSFDLNLVGRKFIPVQRLKSAISMKETDGDWATVGIVYFKSSQTSKNGNNYTLMKITDLHGDIQTASLYLFGRASAKLYSMPLNRVVGILNPKVMDGKSSGGSGGSSKNEVSLSVDHPDKIMEMGDSLDVSRCQAKKNDGSGCTNLVNKASCEFCTYHVNKAYKNISAKRGDLQSAFSGNADVRARIMNKIAPKGEVFAGGQVLNNPHPSMVGRQCAKQTQKDKNLLAGLGVVTLPAPSNVHCKNKVDRLLADTPGSRLMNDAAFFQPGTGKLTFRSHLSESERAAVKKVASGVSEELGLKLLNPTAGARTLMKHLTQQDPEICKEREEAATMTKKEIEARLSSQKQSVAQKMLFEQRKLLAVEKSMQLNPATSSGLGSPGPRLGRGLGSGDFIDLGSSTGPSKTASVATTSSKSSPLDPKKLKALAALKGKTIKKTDPNYVMKRKRSAEDLHNAQKKIAARLENDESEKDVGNGIEPEALNESDERFALARKKARGEKPKEIRSLTGEVIDAKRMAELRKMKSANHSLAEEAELEAEDKYFEKLEKKEAMEEKMLATREIESTVYTCKICNYTAMSQSDLCRNSMHPVKKIKVMKRFFECKKCKKRTISFDKYPNKACGNCGGSSWARTAMMKEKKGPLLDSERLLVRGVEQKFVNANISSSDLHLNL